MDNLKIEAEKEAQIILNYFKAKDYISAEIKAKKLPLTFQQKVKEGAYADEQNIIVKIEDNEFIMAREDLALKGEHNTKNAMAASTVAQLLKIRKQTIRESMGSFQGVEHRLEKVLKINNVQYVNDSKATNINATYYALESVSAESCFVVCTAYTVIVEVGKY